MKIDETPQDNIKTMGGLKKALYALDEKGRYTTCTTTGWEVEEIVLLDALAVEKQFSQLQLAVGVTFFSGLVVQFQGFLVILLVLHPVQANPSRLRFARHIDLFLT